MAPRAAYASLHGRTLLGAANADTGCLAPCVIYADAWTPNFSNRRIDARTIQDTILKGLWVFLQHVPDLLPRHILILSCDHPCNIYKRSELFVPGGAVL